MIDDALETLQRSLGAQLGFVAHIEGDRFRILASRGPEHLGLGVGVDLPFRDTYCVRMLEGRAPSYTAEAPTVPAYVEAAHALDLHIQTYVGAPIHLSDGTLYGTLCAIDERSLPLEPTQEELLRAFARVIGAALSEAQRADELDVANQAITEMQQRQRALVREISHDLRAPLTVITGMAELAGREELPVEQRTEAATRIGANAERMRTMLEGLLDAEAGGAEDEVVVEASELVEDLAEAARSLVASEAVELVTCHDEVAFRTAPVRFRRLALNLVTNAARFTHAGTVSISLARDGDDISLVIADTGPGMTADELATLRDAFRKSPTSTGFGLGTSIVHRLADALGAELAYVSEYGQGTSVQVRLPDAVVRPHVPA